MKVVQSLLVAALLLLANSSTRAAELTGKVLDSTGAPAKGVKVYFSTKPNADAKSIASAETDATGAFKMTDLDANPPQGRAFAWSADAGMASSWVQKGQPTEIKLLPPAKLVVTLVDDAGKPTVGVKVAPVMIMTRVGTGGAFTNLELHPFGSAVLASETAADGTYTLAGIPRGARVRLMPEDDRYALMNSRDDIQIGIDAKTHTQTIKLMPAASIRGRIITRVPGVSVAQIRMRAYTNTGGSGYAITDADGAFELKRLPPGLYQVMAELPSETAKVATWLPVEEIVVKAGQTVENVEIALVTGAIITGRILAAADDSPIPNVTMGAYPATPTGARNVKHGRSGLEGVYTIRVAPGPHRVYFSLSEPPEGFAFPVRNDATVTANESKPVTLDFRLPRGPGPVVAKVVGPDGKPVEGATVFIEQPNFNFVETRTDTDGSFKVARRPDGPVRVRARKENMATTEPVTVADQPIVLKLVDGALGQVQVRVVDASGTPVPGARLMVREMSSSGSVGTSAPPADADGTFKIESLWVNQRYTVQASAEGYGQRASTIFTLKPRQTVVLENLVLKKRDSVLSGVVLDESFEPVASATVNIGSNDSGWSVLRTDSNGAFRATVCSGDTLNLHVRFTDGRYFSDTAKAGATHVVLTPILAR